MYEMGQAYTESRWDCKPKIPSARSGVEWDIWDLRDVLSQYTIKDGSNEDMMGEIDTKIANINDNDKSRLTLLKGKNFSLKVFCFLMLVVTFIHGVMPPVIELEIWKLLWFYILSQNVILLIGLWDLINFFTVIFLASMLIGLHRYSRLLVAPSIFILPVCQICYAVMAIVVLLYLYHAQLILVSAASAVFGIISGILWICIQGYGMWIGIKYIRELRRCSLWEIVRLKQGLSTTIHPL